MDYGAFFAYVFFMTLTPGPNNAMTMSIASKNGFKQSLRFNFGVMAGIIIIFAACSVFASILYKLLPAIEPVMLCICTVYLLWLAWIIWRDKPAEKKNGLMVYGFLSGMVLQLVNVKLLFFALTTLSIFLLPHYKQFSELVPFLFVIGIIGLFATSCWALFGAIFEKLLGKHKKIVNALMALLLVYFAVSQFIGIFKR